MGLPAATHPDLTHRAARERKALWVAVVLILVWGSNFSVQKMVFAAMSPGGFLMVRYLVMPVAAALLLCWRFGLRWPRVPTERPAGAAEAGHRRAPAARRPGDLRHPLVDGLFQLADPGLRAAVHAADPARHGRRDADARPGGRRGGGAVRGAAVPVGQAARRAMVGLGRRPGAAGGGVVLLVLHRGRQAADREARRRGGDDLCRAAGQRAGGADQPARRACRCSGRSSAWPSGPACSTPC